MKWTEETPMWARAMVDQGRAALKEDLRDEGIPLPPWSAETVTVMSEFCSAQAKLVLDCVAQGLSEGQILNALALHLAVWTDLLAEAAVELADEPT